MLGRLPSRPDGATVVTPRCALAALLLAGSSAGLVACDAAAPAPVDPPVPLLTGVWAGGRVYDPGSSDQDALPDTFVVAGFALTATTDGEGGEDVGGVGCAEGKIYTAPLSNVGTEGVGGWPASGRRRGASVTLSMGGSQARPPLQGAQVVFEGALADDALTIRGTVSLFRYERDDDRSPGYRLVMSQPVTLRKISDADDYPADTCDRDY